MIIYSYVHGRYVPHVCSVACGRWHMYCLFAASCGGFMCAVHVPC